ncbi:transcriptional regulator [Leptolyngbya sp. PCC 7375]|nr:transcriptional regulator [Leptolyngbya sp. PCC 7375]
MHAWNEIRTAYQVARLRTVSAAAEYLEVPRATVIRHIDSLEVVLGEKVFQRHSRGYTPTEVGLDLRCVAKTTDEQFGQLVGRTKGRATKLSGEFVVTSSYVVSPMFIPVLNAFQAQHPDIVVRDYVLDKIINITGQILFLSLIALEGFLWTVVALTIFLVGNIVAETIIAFPRIHSQSLDASMIRTVSR